MTKFTCCRKSITNLQERNSCKHLEPLSASPSHKLCWSTSSSSSQRPHPLELLPTFWSSQDSSISAISESLSDSRLKRKFWHIWLPHSGSPNSMTALDRLISFTNNTRNRNPLIPKLLLVTASSLSSRITFDFMVTPAPRLVINRDRIYLPCTAESLCA